MDGAPAPRPPSDKFCRDSYTCGGDRLSLRNPDKLGGVRAEYAKG